MVDIGQAQLAGTLTIPEGAGGLVITERQSHYFRAELVWTIGDRVIRANVTASAGLIRPAMLSGSELALRPARVPADARRQGM